MRLGQLWKVYSSLLQISPRALIIWALVGGKWGKPFSQSKVSSNGWEWASVAVILFKKGKHKPGFTLCAPREPDYLIAEAIRGQRKAQLPQEVADWAISPFLPRDPILVLDPFAGAGTLLKLADSLGHEAVGFEIQKS